MASSLDESTVRHVARLARLTVSDEEAARLAAELSSILGYVEQLGELNVDDVPPTAHPLPITNVFRNDSPQASWTPDQALQNAPQQRDDFFQVPKVLDQDSV